MMVRSRNAKCGEDIVRYMHHDAKGLVVGVEVRRIGCSRVLLPTAFGG